MVTGGVFIGLGSNLGDRSRHIREALRELAEAGDIRVVACSRLYETEPVGGPPGQPRFLNAVAELATELAPRALLLRLLAIEARHGRRRGVPNGPRTLDLDLLIHGQTVVDEPGLVVPHPRLREREFVLRPLAEICSPARWAALKLPPQPDSAEVPAHVPRCASRTAALA